MSNNNHVIELKAYNPPKAVESRQDKWVKFGEKNDYYDFLIERYNNSTTNNQVINNIVKLIYGKGLIAKNSAQKPQEYAQLKTLFTKENVKKAVTDMYLLGQCAFQIIYSKNKKQIVEVQHIPVHLLRPEKCNAEGIIENYYYSDNWKNLREYPVKIIPAFGYGDRTLEIFIIGNYTIGQKYFSSVSYLGGISYAKLEEDISEYLISLVETGFTPLKIINFNNGVPDADTQRRVNDSVIDQTTGASGKKLIISYNADENKKTTIDSVSLDNASAQYEYLSNEARAKIMLSHGVTSGLLFGIPTANGFSSNADELKTAFMLFNNNVIIPNQEQFCDGIDKILAYNGIALDLAFETLNPLMDLISVKEVTQLKSIEVEATDFSSDLDLNEWELCDSSVVDYEREQEYDDLINKANNPSLFKRVQHFASTGTAYPRRNSEQDTKLFKTRYRYSGNGIGEREFCKKMLKANKLYRKEDIIAMGDVPVNKGFGLNGADTYSIWLWKGGGLLSEAYPNGTCKHFWVRETYRRKGTDILSPLAKKVTPAEARKEGEILPTNDPRVYKAPHDMK